MRDTTERGISNRRTFTLGDHMRNGSMCNSCYLPNHIDDFWNNSGVRATTYKVIHLNGKGIRALRLRTMLYSFVSNFLLSVGLCKCADIYSVGKMVIKSMQNKI